MLMFALRYLLLLNIIALAGLATTVTPSAGTLRWMRNASNQTGWFQVSITTNTPGSDLPDNIRLDNVSLLIDVAVGADQFVNLYRAPSQTAAGTGAYSTASTTLFSENCDCPVDTARYFSTLFDATTQILAATLMWTPAAVTTPLYDPLWRFQNQPGSGVFSPDFGALANQVTMVNGGLAFSYSTTGPQYTENIRLSGDAVPEPSTLLLSGIGLAVVIARRITRRGIAAQSFR